MERTSLSDVHKLNLMKNTSSILRLNAQLKLLLLSVCIQMLKLISELLNAWIYSSNFKKFNQRKLVPQEVVAKLLKKLSKSSWSELLMKLNLKATN